jgi:peptidyl-prolyl cis-trans isomerase A (cyclophilin A)
MKFTRKTTISVIIILVFLTSSLVVFSQFFNNTVSTEVIVFETSLGNFEVQMDRPRAPLTVENFVRYVKTGFYNGTVFHRVESGFVIQGGGFTTTGEEKATDNPIKLESNNGLKNLKGTIAMARTNDPNSATSQFYINLIDNNGLDYSTSSKGYAVFGKVISGMDVISSIAQVKTKTRMIFFANLNATYPFNYWPEQDIVINKAYVKP